MAIVAATAARNLTARACTAIDCKQFPSSELDPAKARAGDVPFQLEDADPGLLIQHVLSESTTLAQEYVDALSIHPGTQGNPWRLVVGFDEYVP